MSTTRQSHPTEPPPTEIPRQRRARAGRRVFVATLLAFVALGALGAFGVRTRTVSATGAGYELSVHYAAVSRPGLATPLAFEVRRPGGFPDGLLLAVRSSYFDAFDENGLDPAPVEETTDGERTLWRFAPSAADTIVVSFDARIEPGVQFTTVKGRVDILTSRSAPPAVSVGYRTWVMP